MTRTLEARIARRVLTLVLLAASAVAYAQTAESEQATELDTVEVTGSRIKSSQVEGQTPVFVLSREDLDKTGLTSIGQVLQRMTTGGKALNTQFNSSGNFGFPADGGGIGAGSTQVDLRHLESKRVLVLVDGLRWVNESSASGVGGAVDLNTIPMAIVDHIEVLEDGASALYGSDAIAGVINIITRKDYVGSEINGYYGQYQQNDGQTERADYTWGGRSGALGGVVSLSYANQEKVSSSDRAIADEAVPGTGNTRGSSGTPQGRFIFCDPRTTPECGPDDYLSLALNKGTGTPVYDPATPNGPPSTYHDFTNADRFNFAPYNLVVTPNERLGLFATGTYDFANRLQLYLKGLYNRRESLNRAAPEPIFIGADAGTGGLADTISIPANQPYNPFGIDLNSGQNFSLIGRRPLEGGPRLFNQTVDTYYLATGLRGDVELFSRIFAWDVSAAYSNNRAEQEFRNGYNVRRLQQALGDPGACAAIRGCVPLNIFGGQGANGRGTITGDMLDWVRITTTDKSKNELQLFTANITGDAFELPAGWVTFASGYEYRRYDGSFTPDPVRQRGESQDSPAIPTAGDYNVNEVFAEFNIPVLTNQPLAQRLDLSLALRYSEYSTFGGETTGKLGFRWEPTDEVLVRGTWAQGFRAPFIGELFGLAQFGASITDPCSNSDGTALESKCRDLGVPAGYEQINTQIITNTGGNPELKPEKADSYTTGVVYNPGWAEDLLAAQRVDVELTYYQHEIEDAIRAPDAQTRLNFCVASGDENSVFCQGISRTPNGQINRFNNLLANIGQFETKGLDLRFNWIGREQSWGRLRASWQNTFVLDYHVTDDFGTDFPQSEGAEVNDGAIPEWQSNLHLGWVYDRVDVAWTIRYISAVTESCSDFLDGTPQSLTNRGLCSDPDYGNNAFSENKLEDTIYHDVQVGWDTPLGVENLSVGAGLSNVFNQAPPTCESCSLNGYDAGTYDAPGRFGYVEASYKF